MVFIIRIDSNKELWVMKTFDVVRDVGRTTKVVNILGSCCCGNCDIWLFSLFSFF